MKKTTPKKKKSLLEEVEDKVVETGKALSKKIRNSPVGKKFRAADIHFKKDLNVRDK